MLNNQNISFTLEWKEINYYVPAIEQNNYNIFQKCRKQKEIRLLNDVSGHMKTGDLVAVLGCSGAGKTTLLAAISQRLRGNLSGDVVLNGVAMERNEMTRISSFLPQFEINVKKFTAYEHLYFMSHFKMHRKTTKREKHQRVSDLLVACGLRDVAHTRIQNLSGGERKRLSLAEELITDPPFLFCDEPTTGLDSYSAYTVVKTLRHLCTRQRITNTSLTCLYGEDSFTSPSSSEVSSNNSIEMELVESRSELPNLDVLTKTSTGRQKKAIICSIHQPTSDIFELFTHIILMDAGRVIYQGSTENALEFFTELGFHLPQNCNPADFYLKTISDSHTNHTDGELIKTKYEHKTSGLYNGSWLLRKSYSTDYLSDIRSFKKIRWINQVYLLFMRFMTEDSRNLRAGFINLGIFMITSVTLSIMYSGVGALTQTSIQDFTGSLFMLSNEIIFTFAYGVVFVFPTSLPIIRREIGENIYSLSAYYAAVVLASIPTTFFKSYLFLAVVYASIYASRGIMLYWSMGFILALGTFAATSYGLFLSNLFESDKMATECAAPFDLIFLIFAGVYFNVDSVPFLKYFSIFFYSNEALMYDFWIDVKNITCPANMEHPCIQSGIEVLQRGSFRTVDYTYWFDCIGLVVVATVFNIIGYCFLRKYVKRSGYY